MQVRRLWQASYFTGVTLPETVPPRTLIAWTRLFGMLSFELFGQLVGSVDPGDEFFARAVDEMATFVGLDADAPPR